VRQYAERKLEQHSQESVLEKHLHYFQTLAAKADENLNGAEQIQWKSRLKEEQGNFTCALEWGFEKRPDEAATLTAYLGRYWEAKSALQEADRWLKKAIALNGDLPASTRAKLHLKLLGILIQKGSFEQIEKFKLLSLQYCLDAADPNFEAEYYNLMGLVATQQRQFENAESFLKQALSILKLQPKSRVANYVLLNLGHLYSLQNDLELTFKYLQASLTLARERHDARLEMVSLCNTAWYHILKNQYIDSISLGKQALAIAERIDDQMFSIIIRGNLGYALWQQGHHLEGERIYRDHIKLLYELGSLQFFVEAAFELTQFWTHLGFIEDAVCLWGASEGLRTSQKYPIFSGYEDIKIKVLGAMEEPKRHELLQKGQNLSPRELVSFISQAARPT
jgi:tetratricopeptide (TPR) repeat protein